MGYINFFIARTGLILRAGATKLKTINMIRKLIIAFAGLLVSANLAAQTTGSIKAILVDAATSDAINGAVVELAPTTSPDQKQYSTSADKGAISITKLKSGTYLMTITFLGYEPLIDTVSVEGKTDLGTLRMLQEAKRIDDVKVEVQAMRTSQRGDTVVYNADAFKVNRDADVEGLLTKMPGIRIGSDGSIEAQGETVQKVLVDGREFFGEDAATTVKTIPAEMVKNIEVYNKLSDRAEFTGVDDGEGYKTINIVTSLDKRSGQFGKVYGSYGYEDKYIAGGNVNIFSGDQRISIIGLANNLNQQNFSFEDIVGATTTSSASSGRGMMGGGGGGFGSARNFMVRPQDGVSTVQSVGVNYNNKWDKLELTASYFFNHSCNRNEQTINRWTYTDSDYIQYYDATSNSSSENYNHRLNALLDYKINANNNIRLRANYSYQKYNNDGTTESETSNMLNDVSDLLMGRTSNADSRSNGSNGSVNLLYRSKLNEMGRSLTLSGNYRWGSNNAHSNPLQTIYYPLRADSLYNQRIDNLSSNYTISAEATYNEPLSKKAQLSLEYEFSYRYNDRDKNTWLEQNNQYELTDYLSNISNSGYYTHQVGPGFSLNTDLANISFDVKYQYSTLNNDREAPSPKANTSNSFSNVVYGGRFNFNFDKQNMLRLMMRSYTSNPSISQLQEVPDFSNTQYVTSGNQNLRPSYQQDLMGHYVFSNVPKGRTFMIMGGVQINSKAIVDSTVINNPNFVIKGGDGSETLLGVGNQFTRPVNMTNGGWSARGGVNYGFPLNFLKSNFNVNLGLSYNESKSYLNGLVNNNTGTYYNAGLQIGSNISENLDFSILWNGSYNLNRNSTDSSKQLNKYVSQYAEMSLKWIAWKGITFTTTGSYSQYKGLTDDYNEEIVLWNAYIGKKIFKNQRGELSIGVNDIFNQNRGFSRSVQSTYLQNTTNLAIGRYYAVQFIYNLRLFGKNSKASDFDTLDQNSNIPSQGVGIQRSNSNGGRPMGPPPGGH